MRWGASCKAFIAFKRTWSFFFFKPRPVWHGRHCKVAWCCQVVWVKLLLDSVNPSTLKTRWTITLTFNSLIMIFTFTTIKVTIELQSKNKRCFQWINEVRIEVHQQFAFFCCNGNCLELLFYSVSLISSCCWKQDHLDMCPTKLMS